MALKVLCPRLKSWHTFQLTVPSLLCPAPKPADRASSSWLKIYCGRNKSPACGLGYQPAHFQSCYSRGSSIKRACSANFDEFPDEELSKKRLNFSDNGDEVDKETRHIEGEDGVKLRQTATLKLESLVLEPSLLGIQPEPPQWPERDDQIFRMSIEQRANRVEIPLSLRIIKRKQKWEESLKEAGDFTYCSVNRAFSSMVFMIRELQSYALHIRETLYGEDLQGIIDNMQRELNASFVWLFQQVFPRTPTLMIYVMILLANFTVSSMADNIVIATAAATHEISCATITSETKNRNRPQFKHDFRSFSDTSSGIGNRGGGGKVSHVGDEISEASLFGNKKLSAEEEANLWKSVVEEASRMQAEMRGEALDHETMQRFVSPVTVTPESDDYEDFFKTDLSYQMGLYQDPNNPLLLSNYAQFLYLVAHDNDRAEECFRRAVLVDPLDAEGLSRYAEFLWMARKDMWGAEERFQQAMAAEPGNPFHASKYANFLWSTGGEETCFPLNASSSSSSYDDYN